jgi:hypothetical protein
MNNVSGRVVRADNSAPLPGLIVTLYDLPELDGARAAGAIGLARKQIAAGRARRIGSFFTDVRGSFQLSYPWDPAGPRAGPSLAVGVTGPGVHEMLVAEVRVKAGPQESFLIMLSPAGPVRAKPPAARGKPAPLVAAPAAEAVAQLRAAMPGAAPAPAAGVVALQPGALVISGLEAAEAAAARLVFNPDPEAAHYQLQLGEGARIDLKFAAPRYARAGDAGATRGVVLLIDAEARSMTLQLPLTPSHLEAVRPTSMLFRRRSAALRKRQG